MDERPMYKGWAPKSIEIHLERQANSSGYALYVRGYTDTNSGNHLPIVLHDGVWWADSYGRQTPTLDIPNAETAQLICTALSLTGNEWDSAPEPTWQELHELTKTARRLAQARIRARRFRMKQGRRQQVFPVAVHPDEDA